MAYIKIKEWGNAESDASMSLQLDPSITKSYQRRSIARLSLGKVRLALKDLYLADGNRAEGNETKPLDKKKVEKALMLAMRRAPKKKVSITITSSNENSSGVIIDMKSSFPVPIPSKDNCIQPLLPNVKIIDLSKVKTWYDFESSWKVLQPSEKSQHLGKMKPEKLTDLYKNGMENTDLLEDLLYHVSRLGSNGARYLEAASKISSVDMLVMMMSSKQRERVKANIEQIISTAMVSEEKRKDIGNAFNLDLKNT